MKKSFLPLILAFVSIQGIGQTCNSFSQNISSDGQFIYFSSDRDSSDYEIYKMDTNGYNVTRLTFFDNPVYFQDVSPDGQKLVFVENGYGPYSEIYIMNTNGDHLKRLTNNNRFDGTPTFSPDGQYIIFSAWDQYDYPEIFVMDTAGNHRRQITNVSGAWWHSAPRYSRDMTKIYFNIGYNADNHLAVMDSNGSNWVDITPPNDFGTTEGGLHLIGDESKVIFHTTEWKGYSNGSDVVEADIDGNNWNRLTNAADDEYFYNPVYHPQSGKIYFSHKYPNKPWQIYKMKPDGSDTVRINSCKLNSTGQRKNPEAQEINIYPNPASNKIYIKNNNRLFVCLFDQQGRLLKQTRQNVIAMQDLPTGIYILEIRDNQNKLILRKKIEKVLP